MPAINADTLRNVYVLSQLLQDELEAVAALATAREFSSGEVMFSEGEAATSMFIVTGGTIEVLKKAADGTEKAVGVMSAGTILGEMALVDLAPRAAKARAKDRVWALEIPYAEIESLFASRPEIAVKFFRTLVSVLCKRIR